MENFKKKTDSWWASQIAQKLEYKDLISFSTVLDKTIKTFTALDISVFDNIVPATKGKKRDYQLSRFASYIAVLHADTKKESVNQAKYKIARKTGLSNKTLIELERLGLREELSIANRWLSSKAKKAGVNDYRSFVNAGYMGLYTMTNRQLLLYRNLKQNANIINHMGKIELGANLLRISMLEKAIELQNIKGQTLLKELHTNIGLNVRKSIAQSLKTPPEDLPIEKDIERVKKEIREVYKKLSQHT